MVDPAGRVLYVGKARKLRSRLLAYFRAKFPDDKAARILQAAADIEWDYCPSEFAALLGEIRAIKKLRPPYNVAGNRNRQAVFITMIGGAAPRLAAVKWPNGEERVYGPFNSGDRVREGIRVLNDLLGLRDCAPKMPIVFADQGDLFAEPRQAACLRYDIGQCLGPCAALVTQERWNETVLLASGRSTPLLAAAKLVREAAGSSAPIELPGGELPAGENESYQAAPEAPLPLNLPLEEGIRRYVDWLRKHPAA
jgi:excinuclease ABC subunit C